jgi:hypothetical protein
MGQQLDKDEILGYIQKLKQLESDLSSGETEDMSFLNDLNNILGRLSSEYKEVEFNSTSDLLVRVKRLHPNAVIPSYSKDGDAGMDLTIVDVKEDELENMIYEIGISLEIPKGYLGLILSNNITLIQNNTNILIRSNKKYKIGDFIGKLFVIPYLKFNIIE